MQDRLDIKELDQKLAKLKEIGLKEISKSTKLASSKIEDVLEKRFDKLDRVRARGFINILEREYEMDLSDWLKAQHEYTRKESITNVSQVIAKQSEHNEQDVDSQKLQEKTHEEKVLDIALKAKPIGHSQKESQISFYVIFGLILFVLIGYFAYKSFMDDRSREQNLRSESKQKSSMQTQDFVDSQNPQSTYEGIFFDPSQSSANNFSSNTNPRESQEQSLASSIQVQDILQSVQGLAESTSQANLADNMPAPTASQHNAQASDLSDSLQAATAPSVIKDDILHVRAGRDLWLGVIYLDSGRKEQFLYKKEYDVKINGRMLLVMGHANFTLSLNGEGISHSAKPPVRMYYDGLTLTEIGFTRFKELNGGVEW